MSRNSWMAVAGVALLTATTPLLAHHAFSAEFDAKAPVTLHGTVKQMDWVNPHSWIHLEVKNADGSAKSLDQIMGEMSTTFSGQAAVAAQSTAGQMRNAQIQFGEFQEQIGKFATLRDMINWCIEKPNQGERIESDSDAMKALEAYMYWSNRGSVLDPGRH